MLKQISVAVDNSVGTIQKVLDILDHGHVNLRGFMTNETVETITIRMLVSDTAKAHQLLYGAGYNCHEAKVLGIEIPDKPGRLSEILGMIKQMNCNVDYMYSSLATDDELPVIIIHCDEMPEVEKTLVKKGVIVA